MATLFSQRNSRLIFALCLFIPALLLILSVIPSTARAQGAIKRIGYLEAGPFWLYDRTWEAFRAELSKKTEGRSEFPINAKFSPGWEPENMKNLPEKAAQLLQREDLDLVVGMGTAAVKALLKANTGQTPILGMGMADPIAAGVIASAKDSGVDNFTCRITQNRWSAMFRVFYDVIRFKKLGIMYTDTPEGRVYAALDDARAIASELEFSLVEYGDLSSAESVEECSVGLEELRALGMDAFFIGPLNCFDIEGSGLSILLNKLRQWKVATFARDGSEYVKAGALMGYSTWDFKPIGKFLAAQSHAIFAGRSPRELSMLDRSEPSIALNLATAKAIDFDFPFDVLLVADELHETMAAPNAAAH